MDNHRFKEFVAGVQEAAEMGYRIHVQDKLGNKSVGVEATYTETDEYVVI